VRVYRLTIKTWTKVTTRWVTFGRLPGKEFSVGKYGEEAAKTLALGWLENIKRVSQDTDMYAENHGK
jgi:hypothetical protein